MAIHRRLTEIHSINSTNRNEPFDHRFSEAYSYQVLWHLFFDVDEPLYRPITEFKFVDSDDDVLDAEGMSKESVLLGLAAASKPLLKIPFARVNH
jgi:hypothetical protein